MDFSSTEEQKLIRDAAIKLGSSFNQGIISRDREQEFNRDAWNLCGKFGFQGMLVPKKYGGAEGDILTTVNALEGFGYACKDNGLVFSINAHLWTCVLPLLTFGDEAQKKKYLPKLCSGEWVGGNAITEPNSGSDAINMLTTAIRDGENYILNGSKTFITNAPIANILVVFAVLNSDAESKGITAFLVEKGMSGFTIGGEIEKMGTRTSPMSEVYFDDCIVPVENRLGAEGGGQAIFFYSMEWERAFILSGAVGVMQRQLEACISYAKNRKQFGSAIGKFQMISSKIVEMKMRLETARNMLYKTAWLKSQDKAIHMEAAMTKLYISEAWVQSSLDTIQIHGGYGYTTEFEHERDLRDAIGSRIYSGTSEIQRKIIAGFLGL